jgi:hypothetical protein
MLHKAPQALRSDPAIWLIAGLTVAMHMAFASRYDIFRNELYYIVCGRHPAFGYADEPPLLRRPRRFSVSVFGRCACPRRWRPARWCR